MRLALLGFIHETNTFAQPATEYNAFQVLQGESAIRRIHDQDHSTIAGFLAAARAGVDIVPLYAAEATPSGLITAEAFERIAGDLLRALNESGPWDGVLLALHGAAAADGALDADGEIAVRVRAAVGPAVPIGLTLDLHANVSQRMIAAVTATTMYRTNPHLDAADRALECANLVLRTVRGEIRPIQALATPPLVISILKQYTGEEPMATVMSEAETIADGPGMLSASVAEGFPYADVPEMGMAFLAVADSDAVAAHSAAQRLASLAWARRADFLPDAADADEAVRRAWSEPAGPVVLLDVGDNVPGGSPGDSTVLLHAARRHGAASLLQTLCDPGAVAACQAAGAGGRLTLPVGGKAPGTPAPPLDVAGVVQRLSDGIFEDPAPTHGGGRYFDAGPTAVLATDDGLTLVLTSKRIGNTSIQQMYAVGVRPETYRIVVAKGVVSPRPAYAAVARRFILVNSPGVTTADLGTFAYQRRRRPLFPLDERATWG